MIEVAKSKGMTTEKMMWQSIDDVDEMLCIMEKEHPDMYWNFIRKQYGMLYNYHYEEEFAMYDVQQMKPLGMYWTVKQVEDATKMMAFPPGTTVWDKLVAFNSTKNDLNGVATDEQILKIAHAFWFQDKDWHGDGKIFRYMCLNNSLK